MKKHNSANETEFMPTSVAVDSKTATSITHETKGGHPMNTALTKDPNLNLNITDCFASLEKQNETLTLLKNTDIILGHDTETGNGFLAFGRTLLQAIIADNTSRPCRIVIMNLRQSTSELEMLLAAVQVTHGYHEYLGGGNLDRAEIQAIEELFRLDSGNPRLKGWFKCD